MKASEQEMLLEASLRTAKTDYRKPAALASNSAPGLTVPARALPLWQPCQPSSAPAQQPAVPGRAPSLRKLPLPWRAVPAHCKVIPVSGTLRTYSDHASQHSNVAIHSAKAMSAFSRFSTAACSARTGFVSARASSALARRSCSLQSNPSLRHLMYLQ